MKNFSLKFPKYLATLAVVSICFFPAYSADAVKYNTSQNSRLTSSLVGLWSLDGKDVVNGVAMDRSGNANNLNLLGPIATSTFYSLGKIGQAFNLDGSNDYLNIADNTPLSITGPITISAWINRDTTGTADGIVGKWYGDASQRSYLLGISSDVASFAISSAGNNSKTVNGGTTISANRWYHVVGTSGGSGGYLKVYVDGVLDTSPLSASAIFDATSPLRIGDGDLGYWPFDGKIDEVRIYDRELSATEVKALYLAGGGKGNASQNLKRTSGLVGQWSFDGKDVVNGVALNLSDNRKNGTLRTIATSTFYTTGKIGQAFKFDGTSDYVSFGSVADPRSSSVTLSGWFNYTAFDSSGMILSTDEGDPTFRLTVNASGQNGNIHMLARDEAQVTASATGATALSTGVWYHLTYVWDQSAESVTVYVNGVQDATAANTSLNLSGVNFPAGLYGLGVGIRSGTTPVDNYFNGKMDEVRIYNRALSAAEIKALYLAGSGKANASQNQKNASGLVGLWSFDGKDVMNGVAMDRSGSGLNANLRGSIASSTFYTIGKIGQAFNFDGTSDFASSTDNALYETSGTKTVSFWFNAPSLASVFLVSKYRSDTSEDGWTIYRLSDGTMTVCVKNATPTCFTATGGAYTANTWNHVSVSWDTNGGTVKLYVNGVYVTQSGAISGTFSGNPAPLIIGGLMGNDNGLCCWHTGKIDDVRIYNRVLSDAEIKALYNMGR